MGVALSTVPSTSAVPDFLGELGGQVQYEKSLGASRFLKTIRARHRNGAVVVKVFLKPDPALSLAAVHRALKHEREALSGCANVLAYQRTLETERAGYVIRQWAASNLYDRISTRPFLSAVEKKWIAFQLLTALRNARERNVPHGDIKTENVLVTSWNWIYLTDFASFKPTYLPLDDPSTFSYYFDTSSRRTCYLAPERFFAATTETPTKTGDVTEAMDVFSLGCVLAELWMEGTAIFTLSQLFKYRAGEYRPKAYLAEIEDVEIRALIESMISLDPMERLCCAEYLTKFRSIAFPNIFYDFLHPFLTSLNESQSAPVVVAPTPTKHVGVSTPNGTVTAKSGVEPGGRAGGVLRSEADERIERVWSEWETIGRFLGGEAGVEVGEGKSGVKSLEEESLFPIHVHIPGSDAHPDTVKIEDQSALILLSLVCSNIRNCIRPTSILRGLDILLALNRYLSDETKLDRLVPYLVALLSDDVARIRSAALKALTQTLLLVELISPSNSSIFNEYIFPNTRAFCADPEILPRVTYAQCVADLATTAKRFLEMTEAMKTQGTFKLSDLNEFDGSPYEASYDANLLELQSVVQTHLAPLLSSSSAAVKRALLLRISPLCTFFGRSKANDIILSHLVTYLNTGEWELRRAFNTVAVEVGMVVGGRSLEEYILPLMSLSLADAEESVTVQVIESLTLLAERRLLTRSKVWDLVTQITPFLCHPNIWIREGAAAFLGVVSDLLQTTDRWCILYPTIRRLLRADIRDITDSALFENARDPIPRVIFEAAVAWASKSKSSHFWSVPRTPIKGAPRDASIRTDEDNSQLERMRLLGMKPEDESKLSTLRDYIAKLALARQASPARQREATPPPLSTGPLLQDLGIVPQTIFFGIRSVVDTEPTRQQAGRQIDSLPRRFSFDNKSVSSIDARGLEGSGSGLAEDLRRRLALGGSTEEAVEVERKSIPSRFISTYEGNDPSIQQLLERVYLDTYRQPLLEFGPHVPVGIPRRRAHTSSSFPLRERERSSSRPEGTLIAHLVEHTGGITSIQVSPDHLFFATGSEDGTVKIWDTIRLEKNVTSRSRQTFVQGGKILAVCVLEESRCVASASSNGTVMIHRVDISLLGSLPRYGKIQPVRQWRMEGDGDFVGCMVSYNTETSTHLVLGTSISSIIILDVRTMRTVQTLQHPIHFGPLSCCCIDKNRIWLIVGTAFGTLSLFDLRFGLLLRSWTVGRRRIQQVLEHPSKGKGRWVIVAVESSEEEGREKEGGETVTEVWDIDRGIKVEEFKVLSPAQSSTLSSSPPPLTRRMTLETTFALPEARLDPSAAIEALLASSAPLTRYPRLPAPENDLPQSNHTTYPRVRAFLAGTQYATATNDFRGTHSGELVEAEGIVKRDMGYLITGGGDRKLRYWDLGRPSGSAVVSGLDIDEERPVYSMSRSVPGTVRPTTFLESPTPLASNTSSRARVPSIPSSKVHRSTLIANSQQHLLRGHQAAITALALIDLPFRCIVSGDQSGALKVFE